MGSKHWEADLKQTKSKTPSTYQSQEQALAASQISPLRIQRAIEQPNARTLTPDVVQVLQRTHGNQFVSGLVQRARGAIQTKMMVTPAGDRQEQEADRVASEVMRNIHRQEDKEELQLQRQEDEEELQLQRQEDEEELQLQRQEDEEELMMKGDPLGGTEVEGDIEQSIQAARGSGQALPDAVRAPMESAFGADFGGVRVHHNARSTDLNKSLQAKAFTTGQDIFFKQGAYSPGSSAGQELLAHELTHVVQQNGSAVQRDDNDTA